MTERERLNSLSRETFLLQTTLAELAMKLMELQAGTRALYEEIDAKLDAGEKDASD